MICGSARAEQLDQLLVYAKAGAPDLAIRLIGEQQPEIHSDPQGWARWERALIGLMRDNAEWDALERRLDKEPSEGIPTDTRIWLATQHADTLLHLQQPAKARTLLVNSMWSDSVADQAVVAHWRHLIIQTYLAEGRHDDAYDAMLRYRQDYGDGDRDARLLRAEVLLISDRPADALTQLTGMGEESEVSALRLLASLRVGEKPRQIVLESRRLLKESNLTTRVSLMLWGVTAEANGRLGDQAARAIALEHYFSDKARTSLPSGLFNFTPDSLWDAYLHYGLEIGNREQMLLGDDDSWFKAAQATGRQFPIRARSLYVVLTQRSPSEESRSAAHRALLAQWAGDAGELELIKALYLESSRYPDDNHLPEPVRYFLYDAALGQGDLALASRMLKVLTHAPADVSPFDWQLRGAKVFMLAGDYQSASNSLQGLIKSTPAMTSEQFDRLMQVAFDLQTVGEHERAVAIFEQLALRPLEEQTRRELLYWIGDSRFAQQRYVEAARFYLYSAILPGVDTMDPWAQTARYQAAKALAQGGLANDAAAIYRQLLAVTTDPSRRAVLQHELEQLHLLVKK